MNCSHALRVKLTADDEPAIKSLLEQYPLWKRKDAMRTVRLRKLASMAKDAGQKKGEA